MKKKSKHSRTRSKNFWHFHIDIGKPLYEFQFELRTQRKIPCNKQKEIIKHFFIWFFEIVKKNKIKGRLQQRMTRERLFKRVKKVKIGKNGCKKITKVEKEEYETKHNKDDNIFISFEIFQYWLHPKSWNPLELEATNLKKFAVQYSVYALIYLLIWHIIFLSFILLTYYASKLICNDGDWFEAHWTLNTCWNRKNMTLSIVIIFIKISYGRINVITILHAFRFH